MQGPSGIQARPQQVSQEEKICSFNNLPRQLRFRRNPVDRSSYSGEYCGQLCGSRVPSTTNRTIQDSSCVGGDVNKGRVVSQRLVLVFSSALFLIGSLAFAQHDPG